MVSWTVLGDDGAVIDSVDVYLGYLAALERSPNTQRAYATSLKLWFEFLAGVGLAWDAVRVDDVARFVSWLRSPAENVIVLAAGTGLRSPATVNRHLSAVFGFYEHHARCGVKVAPELVVWRHLGRGAYKPFLHHVSAGNRSRLAPGEVAVGREADTADVERPLSSWSRCWRRRSGRGSVLVGVAGRDRDADRPGVGVASRRFREPREGGADHAAPCGPTTRTGREAEGGGPQRRSRRSRLGDWCAATRTTCTPSMATSTRTTCSSTCGRGGSIGATDDLRRRRCINSSGRDPALGPVSSSRRTCCATRTRPS